MMRILASPKIVVLFFSLAIAFSCRKTEYVLYNNNGNTQNGVYFYYNKSIDTLSQAYFGYSDKDTTIQIYIKSYGLQADTNRSYNLKIIADSTTALDGTDFTISGSYMIKANGYMDTLLLHIFNKQRPTTDLGKKIMLKLIPSYNFDTLGSPTTLENNVEGSFMANTFLTNIKISYSAPEPAFWKDLIDYLGTYTQTKIKELIKIGGLDIQKLLTDNAYFQYRKSNITQTAIKLSYFLQDMADSGTPVLDGDGQPMQLGNYLWIYY